MSNSIKKPLIRTAEKLELQSIKKNKLSNGIPYYIINAGEQELVKIDFIFNAGLIYNKNPLVADVVNALLEAGTTNKTSEEIAEELDFYGAYLELEIAQHHSLLSLYTLNKYYTKTINIITDLIFNSTFPNQEIDTFLKNKLQRHKITRQKTNIISQELFVETIFGDSHPYGKNIKKKNFKDINPDIIRNFYAKNYTLDNLKIIISGKVHKEQIKLLDKLFGQKKITLIKSKEPNFPKHTIKNNKIFSKIDGTMQSSIKIGKQTINKLHPDFFNLSITSIILGGYFGSRLMTNIREDKGYTYGIHSSNMSLLNAGIFIISADSGKDVYQKAIDEIYKELKILRTSYVSDEELSRVKNYLTGSFAKMFNGIFAKSDIFKSLLLYSLDFDYYHKFFKVVKTITPKTIKETAEKYLNEDTMIEVVAGAK